VEVLNDDCESADSAPTPQEVLETCAINLVVSKFHPLQGADDDDDEIDLPDIPLDEAIGLLHDIEAHAIDGDAFQAEHAKILREAFEQGRIDPSIGDAPFDVAPLTLKVDLKRWLNEARNRQPPRPQSSEKQKALFHIIEKLLRLGCIEPCQEAAYSQVHMAPKKKKGEWRVCIDFRALNEATESDRPKHSADAATLG
jgi:hypothetical protein